MNLGLQLVVLRVSWDCSEREATGPLPSPPLFLTQPQRSESITSPQPLELPPPQAQGVRMRLQPQMEGRSKNLWACLSTPTYFLGVLDKVVNTWKQCLLEHRDYLINISCSLSWVPEKFFAPEGTRRGAQKRVRGVGCRGPGVIDPPVLVLGAPLGPPAGLVFRVTLNL